MLGRVLSWVSGRHKNSGQVKAPPFVISDVNRRKFEKARQWIREGYPVVVKDYSEGQRLDGCVIHAICKEKYWTDPAHLEFALALDPVCDSHVGIPTTLAHFDLVKYDSGDRSPTTYRRFLEELKTIPNDGENRTKIPIGVKDPTGLSHDVIPMLIEDIKGQSAVLKFDVSLPRYITMLEQEEQKRLGLRSVYYYGYHSVPNTATELRNCINQTEAILISRIEEIERKSAYDVEILKRQLKNIRGGGSYRLNAIERLEILYQKFPEYRDKKFRRLNSLTHFDLDPYGVPHYRHDVAAWLDSRI